MYWLCLMYSQVFQESLELGAAAELVSDARCYRRLRVEVCAHRVHSGRGHEQQR